MPRRASGSPARAWDLVDNLPQFPGHVHPDLAAFGQIPADHAVPVLVASPLPAGVQVGELRVHA